jgi:integral membrane sensor domain MASE1
MNSSQLFLIPRRSGYPQLLILLGVACTYCLAAALGFQLAVVAKQVTAVWPPTGIALAAILIYGYRVWPAITVSAFLVNYLTGEPWQTALTIGIGNTLEAVVGAYLLKRLGFHNALERLKDVLALIALAAMFSTTISATVGVISLCGAGIASWSSFGSVWLVWWVGDALGNLRRSGVHVRLGFFAWC